MPNVLNYDDEMTRLELENRRLRARLQEYKDDAQPVVDELQQEVARLEQVISAMKANLTRSEKRAEELERETKEGNEEFVRLRLTLATLAAAMGGEVFSDALLFRNLCHLDFDLVRSEVAQGVTWRLVLKAPSDPVLGLTHDTFLRIMEANRKRKGGSH